ncbi:hypothetical protein GCK72_022422 [Caenorhabditis remanei]|uniref:Uncharacterized protein n=1 Tax=Caenorhabditis remanei TaxID=31234 RepID=A0A6A5FTS0_CAERE|nr:hypothetical protein GCK72_022422 [Caenorhabditis remanei]KAF1745972.1 hypothetical protein GCK72_022422 [Caenorhabditis remanei]
MKIFLLLLCSLALFRADPTRMHLQFHCEYNVGKWCGWLTVYEADWLKNDVVRQEEFCETGITKHFHYEINGDGDGSPEYEWSYQLYHNCSSGGQRFCLEPKNTQDVPVNGIWSVEFEADLYNAGSKTQCSLNTPAAEFNY